MENLRRNLPATLETGGMAMRNGLYMIGASVVGVFVLFGQVGAQSPSPADNQSNSQSIAPNIQLPSEVLDHFKAMSLPKASARVKAMKVDLAAEAAVPAFFYFEPQDNGLWAVAMIVPFPKRANVMRSITLQGLVRLAVTLDLVGEYAVPFPALPIFKGTVNLASAAKTTSLSGDLAKLISPAPGSTFSYVHAFETQTTGKGMFSTSRSSKFEASGSCVVASEPKSATTLHSKLKGSFLPVSCEVRRGEAIDRQEYAYLLDSALYFMLNATDAQGKKTTHTITDVEYAD